VASGGQASYEKEKIMKIGILGTGHIGATVVSGDLLAERETNGSI
jgi:hypothetical protein